jgi:hypothetical protein
LLTPSCHNDLADAFVPDAYNNLSKKRVKGRPAVLVADDRMSALGQKLT